MFWHLPKYAKREQTFIPSLLIYEVLTDNTLNRAGRFFSAIPT